MRLRVLNPCGSIEDVKYRHAPRLEDLHGKTVCELSTALWEYNRTFPLIREQLQARYPDVKVIPYNEMPLGVHNIDIEDIGDIARAKGCDAVIGGNSS